MSKLDHALNEQEQAFMDIERAAADLANFRATRRGKPQSESDLTELGLLQRAVSSANCRLSEVNSQIRELLANGGGGAE